MTKPFTKTELNNMMRGIDKADILLMILEEQIDRLMDLKAEMSGSIQELYDMHAHLKHHSTMYERGDVREMQRVLLSEMRHAAKLLAR